MSTSPAEVLRLAVQDVHGSAGGPVGNLKPEASRHPGSANDSRAHREFACSERGLSMGRRPTLLPLAPIVHHAPAGPLGPARNGARSIGAALSPFFKRNFAVKKEARRAQATPPPLAPLCPGSGWIILFAALFASVPWGGGWGWPWRGGRR